MPRGLSIGLDAGPGYPSASSACSRSLRMSSTASIPTDMRTNPSPMPMWARSSEHQCVDVAQGGDGQA
jgi:hypothetical protein